MTRSLRGFFGASAALTTSLYLLSTAAGAVGILQGPPDGPPPFGGPPPPGFGPEGGPGMGRSDIPPPGGPNTMIEENGLTPALIPADALTVYLDLSPDQRKKVEAAIDGLRNALVALRPQRRPTGPPSREEHEAMRATVQTAHDRADQAISDTLTPDQRRRLPTVVTALKAVQASGTTLSAAALLRLTPEQVDAIARSNSLRAVRLTDTQREIAELNPDRTQRNFR